MRLQLEIALVNESSEPFPNVVTPLPFSNQHSPNSYSVISISEIDFVILEIFQFYGRNKLGVTMAKYRELISIHDGGVSEEFRSLLA